MVINRGMQAKHAETNNYAESMEIYSTEHSVVRKLNVSIVKGIIYVFPENVPNISDKAK